MGNFRITTTERTDDREDRATGCAPGGPQDPARSLGCTETPPDTPGYGACPGGLSPLTEAEAKA